MIGINENAIVFFTETGRILDGIRKYSGVLEGRDRSLREFFTKQVHPEHPRRTRIGNRMSAIPQSHERGWLRRCVTQALPGTVLDLSTVHVSSLPVIGRSIVIGSTAVPIRKEATEINLGSLAFF